MPIIHHADSVPDPIELLAKALAADGTSIVSAAFRYSFFVDPARVRERCPYYPDRARMSREHYPGGERGHLREWQGRSVTLGDNAKAQEAWARYTGQKIARRSGYGVRHIWGHPWNPDAFTAGWNLCYMPFWLGMLTEDQHPYRPLVDAIQQAAFDLFFGDQTVCDPPDFVKSPGINLRELYGDLTINILTARTGPQTPSAGGAPRAALDHIGGEGFNGTDAERVIKKIRTARNASWSNLLKATAALQNLPHEPFGTSNVANTSKSIVRLMCRETGLSIRQVENLIRTMAK